MLILGLDSAGNGCSVCLWQDKQILASAEERMLRGQDRRFVPMILEVMQKAELNFSALDRIGVTRGPGSFTGLRIGLATARGLGLAAKKPVIGIDRFAIYREQIAPSQKDLLVVIDSKRAELFCRLYPSNGHPQEPNMMTMEEIKKLAATNKNLVVTGDNPFPDVAFQKAKEMETVTAAHLTAKAMLGHPNFLPRPLYIREPDVTVRTS